MGKRSNMFRRNAVASALALILAFAARSVSAQASHDEKQDAKRSKHMTHIKTEALRPGDSLAMVCRMCKNVTVHAVAGDQEHVKLMTFGQRHTCPDCGGSVEVVGTGKGEGKHQEVKHVCSHCGDDAMFVCATKPGGGAAYQQHGK